MNSYFISNFVLFCQALQYSNADFFAHLQQQKKQLLILTLMIRQLWHNCFPGAGFMP